MHGETVKSTYFRHSNEIPNMLSAAGNISDRPSTFYSLHFLFCPRKRTPQTHIYTWNVLQHWKSE